MAGINVPGLGSGLDIAGMSSGLAQAEMGGFIKEAQRKQFETTNQISSLSQISVALSSFQGTLSDINVGEMTKNTLTYAAKDKVINISASGRAVNGNYDIEVLSLASSHRLKSQEFDDSQIFQGTLNISTDNESYALTVPENSSIFALAQQINTETEGISAVVVDNGSGNVLSISSETTGTDGTIEITGTDDASAPASELNKLSFNSSSQIMSEVKSAADASIKINGVEIISSDNNFDDAISGLEISVNNSIAIDKIGEVQEFTIKKDNRAIKNHISQLVKDYNSIITGIKQLSNYDAEKGEAAVFTGDADIRTLVQKLTTAMMTPIDGISGKYNTLYSIGIKSTNDGSFIIDESILDKAIEDEEESVMSLLAAGLNSNHEGVVIDTEMSDEIGVFNEDITITSVPNIASIKASAVLFSDPHTTPHSITEGINLLFNGTLLISALGEGGDDLDFTNYDDFLSQINADLASQNIPITAKLEVNSSGGTPPSFFTAFVFEQDNPIEGTLSIETMGSLSSFYQNSEIPAEPGKLIYKNQEYDHFNAFTLPDKDIDLVIDPASINPPDQVELSASKGYAYRINALVASYVEGDGAILESKETALKSAKDRLTTKIEELNEKKDRVEARYLKQFQALDMILVRMKQQSESLNGQLDSIRSLTDSINR